MWKRNETATASAATNGAANPSLAKATPGDFRSRALVNRSSTTPAVLGNTVTIKGEITGSEDLVINGHVEGSVSLGGYIVTIGSEGRVIADLYASEVEVEGSVDGDIVAEDKITIRAEGIVSGNIKAPRIVLEEGCQFKGSVAMDSDSSRDSYSSGIVDIETEPVSQTAASYIVNKDD